MNIQTILWLDIFMAGKEAMSLTIEQIEAYLKEKKISLFYCNTPCEFIKKAIELNDAKIDYAVLSETDLRFVDEILIPKELYQPELEDHKIITTDQGFLGGMIICKSLYVDPVLRKNYSNIVCYPRLKKPKIIFFTVDCKEFVINHWEQEYQDVLPIAYLNKFAFEINDFKKIIESL